MKDNTVKRKRVKRAERKTRDTIHAIEEECEKTVNRAGCSAIPCSKCKLNHKFTNIVGMSIDEFANYEPVRLERGRS